MHVITKINGKDALPVRAIPLLTDWQGLSPDGLAKILAGDSDRWPSFDGLTAHRLHTDGSIEAIPPRWWRSWVVDKLQAISHTIKANQTSHETGRQQWRCASLAQLPAGVFVWRDEFETAHTMEYGPEGARARSNPQGFDPSVHILNFNPHPDPAIATLGMVLEGFNRAADGRPFDYPLKAVDAKRWERFGELSVEEAAFVVAGLEPPPISVIRYQPIPYQESPGATWARPNEYDDFVRAATSAIERGIISARSKIQDMHTVQLVELFDVLEWAEATGFTVALKLDGPSPARKSAPVQSVESDSTPAAEPVADRASTAALVAGGPDDGEAWKVKARDRANEIIKRQRERDLHPSQINIADEIAREFREGGIVGAGGKPLTGAYIKRHALKGISSAKGRQLSTSIRRGK